jgi:hypothetical protein
LKLNGTSLTPMIVHVRFIEVSGVALTDYLAFAITVFLRSQCYLTQRPAIRQLSVAS